jgi:aspartate racemase
MSEVSTGRNPDRIIGILGGMGPRATLDLFRHIINLTPVKRDQDHIRVLIYSNPKIPDRTQAIVHGGESPLPSLIETAKLLEKSGAGIIAMPCNTAHHFLPEIRQQIGIPFLDMIDAVCRKLCRSFPFVKTVGLLSSIGTVRSGIYDRCFSAAGIRVITPCGEDQTRVQSSINQIKVGDHNRSTQETLQSIGAKLVEAGAEAIVLGCTEIPLAFDSGDVNYTVLNSTRVLAEAAVDWALGRNH